MLGLKRLRVFARYNVLTSVVALAALTISPSIAADKVNPAGTTLTTTQTIDTGSGYTNNGVISPTTFSPGIVSTGAITFFLNNGTVASSNNPVFIDMNNAAGVTSFINNGTIRSSGTATAVAFSRADGRLINLINNGSITNSSSTSGNGIDISGNAFTTSLIANNGEIRGGDNGIRMVTGLVTITNSGNITGVSGNAITLSGEANTVRLLTGSQLLGGTREINFFDGNDTLDFSGFYGTAVIRTADFDITGGDTLIAGDRPFTTTGGNNPTFTVFDQTGASSMDTLASSVTGSIQTAIANELGGFSAGNFFDASAASGYMPQRQPSSAETAANEAVLSELDISGPSRATVWGDVFGGFSTDSVPVSLNNVYGGIVAGSHYQLDGQTRLGGLVSYARSSLSVANGQQVIDTHTGTLGVYGNTDLGVVELSYSLLGGGSSHASSRRVVIGGVGAQTVTGSFASWFINPSLGISVPVLSDDTSEINLAASASYIYGGVGSYTESSANFSAVVGAMPIGVFEARLELNGERNVGTTAHGDIRARGKVGVLAQANMGSANIPLVLNGASTSFANPGTTDYGVYAGLGLNADIADNVVLDVGVDLSARFDGTMAGAATVGLIGSF